MAKMAAADKVEDLIRLRTPKPFRIFTSRRGPPPTAPPPPKPTHPPTQPTHLPTPPGRGSKGAQAGGSQKHHLPQQNSRRRDANLQNTSLQYHRKRQPKRAGPPVRMCLQACGCVCARVRAHVRACLCERAGLQACRHSCVLAKGMQACPTVQTLSHPPLPSLNRAFPTQPASLRHCSSQLPCGGAACWLPRCQAARHKGALPPHVSIRSMPHATCKQAGTTEATVLQKPQVTTTHQLTLRRLRCEEGWLAQWAIIVHTAMEE